MLILQRPWDSQPQGVVSIDWSNPITWGLASALVNGIDVVTSRSSGLVQVSVSTKGCTERGVLPYRADADVSEVTLIAHHKYTSNNGDYAGNTYGFYTSGASCSDIGIAYGAISGGAAADIYGVRRDNADGTTVLEADVTLPYEAVWAITGRLGVSGSALTYKNGIPATSVARAGSGTFSTNSLRTLSKGVSTSTGKEYAWAYRFTRILSVAEIKSLSDDPWQIFERQHVYIPTSITSGGAYTLNLETGSYSFTGSDAVLLKNSQLTLDSGSYSLTGSNASLLKGLILEASSGTYTLSGSDASLLYTHLLSASSGTYTINGADATLTYTPASGTYTLNAESGTYLLTGSDVTFIYSGSEVTIKAGSWIRYRIIT